MATKRKQHLRRVAIVGFTEHRRDAPWGDNAWTLWGMNNLHTVIGEEQTGQTHAWFNLHPRADAEKDTVHMEWAREYCKVPYYTFESFGEDIGTNVVFPASHLIEKYGTKYFTNSVSWMIAFAMDQLEPALVEWKQGIEAAEDKQAWADEKRPVIGIWGVDMAATSEYAAQRPSCELFIGYAMGLGYAVTIASGSDLMKSASMYGVGDDGPIRTKMKERLGEHQLKVGQLNEQKQGKLNELAQIDGQLNQFQGAITELQYFHGVWTQPAVESTRGEDDGEPEGT